MGKLANLSLTCYPLHMPDSEGKYRSENQNIGANLATQCSMAEEKMEEDGAPEKLRALCTGSPLLGSRLQVFSQLQ